MSDPIANMLVRIKNGYQAEKKQLTFPYYKFGFRIVEVMKDHGYLADCQIITPKDNGLKKIKIKLKYTNNHPAIIQLKRVSKSGRRWYIKAADIKRIAQGQGLTIVSTSAGLMTNEEARSKKIGGEVICELI